MADKTTQEKIYDLDERINVWAWVEKSATGIADPSVFSVTGYPRNDLKFNMLDVRGRKTVYIEQGIEHELLIVFAKACIVKLRAEKSRLERDLAARSV